MVCATTGSGGPPVSDVEVKADISGPSSQGSVTLSREESDGCYEATSRPETAGNYTLNFGGVRSGYKRGTASLSFNVTNAPPSIVNTIAEYRDQHVGILNQFLSLSAHVAHDGDWFKAKLI